MLGFTLFSNQSSRAFWTFFDENDFFSIRVSFIYVYTYNFRDNLPSLFLQIRYHRDKDLRAQSDHYCEAKRALQLCRQAKLVLGLPQV